MPASYDEALAAVRARLGEDSLAHSERVAQTAARLAAVYGADEADARLAGLLHDWDRECGREELVDSARTFGLPVSEADESQPYLLHAKTGAEEISRTFPGIAPAVLRAVARHTVGAQDMSVLDKVVYLADMLEPARDYEGADELRDLVGAVSLDELFARGYQQSVRYLVDARRRIHPDTVAVWNAHVARESR
jgi:predicted HD superfamily hydrolase involved in NAD metabolism